ncbi:hypothetical protein CK203_091173 [Vitis vinifera]|uniref:Uncharacterized protein n=1 Tax=Vitis vinifera TaxID=29760 RepID=A0A438EYB8_VITVI|nr:hypothetical protein CK203_091173 [Vitis vinifera]
MRRASALASSVLSRTLLSAQEGATTTAVIQHRIFQAALYGTTTSAAAQSTRRRWYSTALHSLSGGSAKTVSLSIAGALFSVAAATSLSEEVLAKEPPSPDLVPKDVVLYQYEACPFLQ